MRMRTNINFNDCLSEVKIFAVAVPPPIYLSTASLFVINAAVCKKLDALYGLTREQFERNTIIVTATELIGSQTNVNQAGAASVYQNVIKQLDLGGFIQEEVNMNDKVYLTAG